MSGEVVNLGEVLSILKENDGRPQALLKHNDAQYSIAQWKANPWEYDLAYDDLMETVNWRKVEMKKAKFEKLTDELVEKYKEEETASDDGEEKEIAEMDPDEFYSSIDLNEMIDRQRAYHAFEWVKANTNVFGIEEESKKKGDILFYDDGIWHEGGEKYVDRVLNDLLREFTGTSPSKQLQQQFIKTDKATTVPSDELGLDEGYVAVKNGLLNLEDGKIERDLRPDDYAITQVPWEYDPDAECKVWERFISESVENGKQDLIQEYVGYCLYRGGYPFAKALMLLGDGQNGKTTFINAVERLLGAEENVMNADLSELAGGRFSAYRLEGKLANINADIENDEIENISMFKSLTGGDSVQVEQKYGDPYDHRNSAKMIFASNHIPKVDTNEHAFYRRWLLVQFPHTFTLKNGDGHPDADSQLEKKLEGEMEGILAWAVEGVKRLLANNGQFTNARTPEEVRENWYQLSNPMGEFVRECLYEDPNESPATSTAEIYKAYERFMADKPSSPATQQQLTSYIKKRFDGGQYGSKTKTLDNGERESYRGFGAVHIDPMKR